MSFGSHILRRSTPVAPRRCDNEGDNEGYAVAGATYQISNDDGFSNDTLSHRPDATYQISCNNEFSKVTV